MVFLCMLGSLGLIVMGILSVNMATSQISTEPKNPDSVAWFIMQ